MLQYFLLANVYALLFLGLYTVMLKGSKNHSWSRFYLLSSVLISILLPWIKINLSNVLNENVQTINLSEVILHASQKPAIQSVQTFLSWESVYLFIVFVLIVQLVYRIIALKTFLNAQQLIRKEGFRIGMNTGYGPASFGDVILFPANDIDENILEHEKAHLHLKHHYDKMLLQILRCFFFPIIAFHLVYKELMAIHEFEADEKASLDKDNYSNTLLAAHFDSKQFYLLQNFFHHPLKRRIMMLYKNKQQNNGRKALLLIFSTIFLSSILLLQSNTPLMAQHQQKEEKIFTSVEVTPEFTGGMMGLQKYLAENIHYPDSARSANIQGRVIIQFVVSKEGFIKDVVIKRNLVGGCGEEAKRVVEAMPKWKPGTLKGKPVNVYYTLPVTFRLEDKATQVK